MAPCRSRRNSLKNARLALGKAHAIERKVPSWAKPGAGPLSFEAGSVYCTVNPAMLPCPREVAMSS